MRSSGNPSPRTGVMAPRHHPTARTSEPAASREHGTHQPEIWQQSGRTFYTHISDQYAPFSAKVVNVGVRTRPSARWPAVPRV
jgi:hypothetical protein